MKFIKYQLVFEDLKEKDFEEKFGEGHWEHIETESNKYGIQGFGVNGRDKIVVIGEIVASNASICNGLMTEFKSWLKQHYKSKVTEHLIAKGTNPFRRF